MLFERKAKSRDEVEGEVKKIVYSIMKSYEREEMREKKETVEAFFEQLDSLRIIELVVLTEKKFKIAFTSDHLAKLTEKDMDTYVDLVMTCLEEAA